MSWFESLKLHRQLISALSEAERTGDIGALTSILLAHPETHAKVEEAAQARQVNNFNLESLLFTTALAMVRSKSALPPLENLVRHSLNSGLREAFPIPWEKLPAEQLRGLRACFSEFKPNMMDDFFRSLTVDDSQRALGRTTEADFEACAQSYLRAGKPADGLANVLVGEIEGQAIAGKSDAGSLAKACGIARELWAMRETGAALDVLTAVVLADPQAEAPALIDKVAFQLPDLTGLPRIRAANLLRRYPDPMWLQPLKETWVRLERELVEQQERLHEDGGSRVRVERERNNLLEYGAASVAVALGMAAACDDGYVELEESPQSKELSEEIDRRNELAGEHRDLKTEYRIPSTSRDRRDRIEARIIEIQEQIGRLDLQIEQLRKELKMRMSAGNLLAHVLQDEQTFPASVRQAAAWGLHKLIVAGSLHTPSRDKLQTLIRKSAFDRNESSLSEQIGALNLDQAVAGPALKAALGHLELGNWPKLHETLVGLGLDDIAQKKVEDVVRAFEEQTSPSHQFQERVVEFSAGQRFQEFEQAVLDALVWMLDLIEGQASDGDEVGDWDYTEVPQIVRMVWERVPNAVEFLSKYPLRLMTSEQHATVLGKYTRTKAGISQWTRYTPPIWQPGMDPAEAGNVISRYHELDDRSAPNAMGITWRLFAHRILAVPTIYHEFMHYGGPEGEPAHGIANECEVHLREAIFTRELIMAMAPAGDGDLLAYGRKLARLMLDSGQKASLMRLFADLRADGTWHELNAEIEGAYGRGMDKADAATQTDRLLDRENRNIQLLNATGTIKLHWHPEIEWPLLGTVRTRAITDRYRKVVFDSLTTSQCLSREGWDRVLAEPAAAEIERLWQAYVGRGHLAGFIQEIRSWK